MRYGSGGNSTLTRGGASNGYSFARPRNAFSGPKATPKAGAQEFCPLDLPPCRRDFCSASRPPFP